MVGAGGGLHLDDHLIEREAAGRLARREVPEGLQIARDIGLRGDQQEDAIAPSQRVVVLDDLLATGGTMQAAIELVRTRGGTVAAAACIIELAFLEGRSRLDVPFTAMISYDS